MGVQSPPTRPKLLFPTIFVNSCWVFGNLHSEWLIIRFIVWSRYCSGRYHNKILKRCVSTHKRKLHIINGTIPLLANDDLSCTMISRSLAFIGRKIHLGTMNKANDIGVLFDGAGLTKIRKDWTMIIPAFNRATQLR